MLGITLVLTGLTAGGAGVRTDLASQESPLASAQPANLKIVPITVTSPVQADARRDALGRQATRQLPARHLAAPQLATRKVAARKVAARKVPAPAAAASRGPARASRAIPRAAPVSAGTARAIARDLLDIYGWALSQFDCLDPLWMRESGWRLDAENSSSGAYGIPQALPGSKMATAGADWQTNPATQITWGLRYVKGRYGSPCGAWAHFQSSGWY